MTLTYHRGDERPAWQATVTVNGQADDLSSGYTFAVKIATRRNAEPVTTKTTGITGAAAGIVTVAWSGNALNITPGRYIAQLKATRTSDSAEWTIEEEIEIRARL
jgi:hypothetical protein